MGNASSVSSGSPAPVHSVTVPSSSVSSVGMNVTRAQNSPLVSGSGLTNNISPQKLQSTASDICEGRIFDSQWLQSLKQPMEFSDITFVGSTFVRLARVEKQALQKKIWLTFNRVCFINFHLSLMAGLPAGSSLTHCSLKIVPPQFNTEFNRVRLRDISRNWAGTIIDGGTPVDGYPTSHIDLSGINMQGGGLINMGFHCSSGGGMMDTSFCHARFINVIFQGGGEQPNALYQIIHVNLDNLEALNLVIRNACFKDVSLDNVRITHLLLDGRVNLTGARFGHWQPGNITLGDKMLLTPERITRNLNSLNPYQAGGYYFETLETIENQALQRDLAEQLVGKCRELTELRLQLERDPALKLSLIYGLKKYDASPVVDAFLRQCVLSLRDELLPQTLVGHSGLYQYIASLFKQITATLDNRFDYQFLAHQLMIVDPALKAFWYQALPAGLIAHVSSVLQADSEEILQGHIFYSIANKRALYVAADDFAMLLSRYQSPRAFAHFSIDSQGEVETLVSDPYRVNHTLRCFTPLHRIWAAAGRPLAAVMVAMLDNDSELSEAEKARLETIKKHFVGLLSHSVRVKLDLTSAYDVNILYAVLSPYYQGKGASARRNALIIYMQQCLAEELAGEGLSDKQQKSLMALLLAKILTSISSSMHCGTEGDSLRSVRLLAYTLLADCRKYWPGLISKRDAGKWREVLMPSNRRVSSCTFDLTQTMDSFAPPPASGEKGKKMVALLAQLYPL